jgi:hypothetical protein
VSDEENRQLIDVSYAEHCNALYAVVGLTAIIAERDGRDYAELPGPPSNSLRIRGVLEGGIVFEAHEWTRDHLAGLSAPRHLGPGGWIVALYRWELLELSGGRGSERKLCSVIPVYPWYIKGEDRSARGLVETVKTALRAAAVAA